MKSKFFISSISGIIALFLGHSGSNSSSLPLPRDQDPRRFLLVSFGGSDQLCATRYEISSGSITSCSTGNSSEDNEELELCYKLAKKQSEGSFLAEFSAADSQHGILIQERLIGQEFGMDVINDLNGRHVCTFIKRKIRMRAGQTDQAETVKDDRLEMIGQLIGQKLGHVGFLDCDAFVTERGCYVIDINPRIGGGYPFAQIAGANLPAALIAWASGQQADQAWFSIEPNVAASRCDTLVVINRKSTEIARPRIERIFQRIPQNA